MPIIILTNQLEKRCGGLCELCNAEAAIIAYAVSPCNHDSIDNEVALCITCEQALNNEAPVSHWKCLAQSIWNTQPSVQALCYRILYGMRTEDWARDIITSVELDEEVINWALTVFHTHETP